MKLDARVEDLLRGLAPQVLGILARRYDRFDAAEDAVQEALLAAAVAWPRDGIPDNPRGWLITVAARRMTDELRSEQARRRREDTAAAQVPPGELEIADEDDTLSLLFLCCHPALSPASQVALTLRAVGGLTTAQIASAFLVPEATMAQRISRAKQTIKSAGATFGPPPEAERSERLAAVLHVLYLIFNEGYTASGGPDLQRTELTREAIRLDPCGARPAAGRRRGRRAAGADAADRCAPPGADAARRHARPAGRAGPLAVEPGGDRRRASRW